MNTIINHISTAVILIVSLILAWLLATNANAYYVEQERQRLCKPINSVNEQLLNFCETLEVRRYLDNHGWLSSSVTDEEFERYFVTVQQYCSEDSHVYPALALAVIAVESNFDTNAYSNAGARGLMQLMPAYHTSSLSQFKGSPATRDDFFVPEWNIGAGIAYLSETIDASLTYSNVKDPIGFALMWYNQGPTSASRTYLSNGGHLSEYADRVLQIADALQEILSKGDVYRAKT